jgi:cathepsin B
LALVFAILVDAKASPVINEKLIKTVNDAGIFQAHENKGSTIEGMTKEQVSRLCGAKKGGPKLPPRIAHDDSVLAALPTSFSSITAWPQCPSMSFIRDQSACGSCWAIAAVEAMTDRSCIALKKNLSLSAAGMAFCCDSCGDGCNGGFPASAWQYYQETGVVEESCYPYPFPSCDHHEPGSKNPCPTKEYSSPACPYKCTNKSWTGSKWNQDRHHGRSAYSVTGVKQIMAEIMTNGPVEAAFDVYEDFTTYKSGVYQHTTGDLLGGHAVKIIGWGVDNGTPYWIIANSWNPSWGLNGFFWMLRGSDECGIEDGVVAGIPKD